MKVSVNWLKELVEIHVPVEELAHTLTMAGLEVEEITPVAAIFNNIVVAEVKATAAHPNADKLRVCIVDAGTGMHLQIVCGAPNVTAGMRVPCALVGAKLPGIEIRQATFRGVESNGMLCSASDHDQRNNVRIVVSKGNASQTRSANSCNASSRELLSLGDQLDSLAGTARLQDLVPDR